MKKILFGLTIMAGLLASVGTVLAAETANPAEPDSEEAAQAIQDFESINAFRLQRISMGWEIPAGPLYFSAAMFISPILMLQEDLQDSLASTTSLPFGLNVNAGLKRIPIPFLNKAVRFSSGLRISPRTSDLYNHDYINQYSLESVFNFHLSRSKGPYMAINLHFGSTINRFASSIEGGFFSFMLSNNNIEQHLTQYDFGLKMTLNYLSHISKLAPFLYIGAYNRIPYLSGAVSVQYHGTVIIAGADVVDFWPTGNYVKMSNGKYAQQKLDASLGMKIEVREAESSFNIEGERRISLFFDVGVGNANS